MPKQERENHAPLTVNQSNLNYELNYEEKIINSDNTIGPIKPNFLHTLR